MRIWIAKLIPREMNRPPRRRLDPRSCFFVVSRPEAATVPDEAGGDTVRASLTPRTGVRRSVFRRVGDPRPRRVRGPCGRCARPGRP